MIPKFIHQIYGIFDDGVDLNDIPVFKKNTELTKKYCLENNYGYKLWSLKDCEELLCEDYPEYIDLWNEFRHKIQRADFIRYLILHKFGGFYVDCDVFPMGNLDDLLNNHLVFTCWTDDKKKLPYNAVMGAEEQNDLFIQICQDVESRTYEKQKMSIYDKWVGRLVFQTTGHYMLNKNVDKKYIFDILCIKNDKKKIKSISNNAYFYDDNASSWYSCTN